VLIAGATAPAASAALAAAVLAVAAPSAAGQQSGLSGAYDPAASGRAVAVGVLDVGGPAVVVRRPGVPPVRYEGARAPALDGERLAYVDASGLRVVRWRTGEELARLTGPLTKPALDWPRIAYVRVTPSGQRLEVSRLTTGGSRLVASAGRGTDLGRPALRGGLIAWHVAAGRRSEIRLTSVARLGRGRVVAASVTGLQVNPSLSSGRILWVEQAASSSYLRLQRIAGGRVRTLATLNSPNMILWTTALGARRAYVTRWAPTRGRAQVVSRAWR
jgi:hypothetical protein